MAKRARTFRLLAALVLAAGAACQRASAVPWWASQSRTSKPSGAAVEACCGTHPCASFQEAADALKAFAERTPAGQCHSASVASCGDSRLLLYSNGSTVTTFVYGADGEAVAATIAGDAGAPTICGQPPVCTASIAKDFCNPG
jgi:hypothetical protein